MAYDIRAVKQQWEGHETPLVWGRYPVEHEPSVLLPETAGASRAGGP
jgi:hypothetical protein